MNSVNLIGYIPTKPMQHHKAKPGNFFPKINRSIYQISESETSKTEYKISVQ